MLFMRTLAPVLFVLLTMIATPASLLAQVPPAGTGELGGSYELTKANGAPVVGGAQVGITVTPQPGGNLKGDVWIDRNDGLGRIPIPAEQFEIVQGCHDYSWTSAKGGSGCLSPFGSNGQYYSSNNSGPQNDRILTPL